jgi:hypothetical protein
MKNEKGLKHKYDIRKARDNSRTQGRYFVLKLDSKDSEHAAACREALKAYARRIRVHLPELAGDIIAAIDSYESTGAWVEWDRHFK